ncbi:MAG: TraR/DksA family transcriptional regulator [Draconibacterium sp.]|nr:TraR/DksA family transcriptional regulator [Draconibacterium sp.]
MSPEEKVDIVEIIHSEIEKLKLKITQLSEFTGPIAPDDAIGRISRMDAINNKSIMDASMRNLETRLDQLHKISQVVHEKEFGQCTKCHKLIPIERLRIRPEIRICASCLKR